MQRLVVHWQIAAGLATWTICLTTWAQLPDDPIEQLSAPARQAYERGLKQLEASEFEQAGLSFTEVIALHPEFAEAYTARAAAYQGVEPRLADNSLREEALARAAADRERAKEIRADRRRALEPRSFRPSPSTVFALTPLYFGARGILFYSWKVKRFPMVWPILGFFLCGPLSLLFLGLYALAAEANPLPPDPAFDDHPLEVVLRHQGQPSSGDTKNDEPSTKPCRNCGRINSSQTRICPSCEQRIG